MSTSTLGLLVGLLLTIAITTGGLLGLLLAVVLGGGGFLLFYVKPEKQAQVMQELQDLLYVPFEFEDAGTQVVYYKAEDYLLDDEEDMK